MEHVEAAHIAWRPLGRLLVEQGLLTDDELERALALQQTTGRRLGETIVELGFVSGPDLASSLATQYGIELTQETGFGTGLRAQIQRRHENDRGMPGPPALSIVDAAPFESESEPEPGPRADDGGEVDTGEALLLTQLEEQWARLAAAEDALAESEREAMALKHERDRRRKQAARFVGRMRDRERQLEQPHEELGRLARVTEEQLAEIERLTSGAEGRNAEIGRLTRDVHDRNMEIERMSSEAETGNATFEQLSSDLQDRNTQIERLNGEVETRSAEIGRLTGDVHDRNTTIDRLTGDADSRNAEIKQLTRDVEDRDAEIQRLTSDVNDRSGAIERLAGDVKGCDVEIERLGQENVRLRAQATRFVTRLRREPEEAQQPDASVPSSHLLFIQLDDGYQLIESDGPPPQLHTLLELPQFEDEFVVTRLGRSPLPADARSCIFVQRA